MVVANLGAAKRSEVGAGAELFTNVFGESADIGARTTMNVDGEFGVAVAKNFDAVNFDLAGGDFKILAFSG